MLKPSDFNLSRLYMALRLVSQGESILAVNLASCFGATSVFRCVAGRVKSLNMSELSDEASESEQLGASLSLWLGDSLVRPEELDVPLDLHTACSIGQYDVVAECIKKWVHSWCWPAAGSVAHFTTCTDKY